MSTAQETEPEELLLDPMTRRARRRRAAMIAGAFLAVSLIIVASLLLVSTSSGGRTSVLIGTWGTDRLLGLAGVVSLGALAVGLCAIPVARLWLLLLVPVRIVAIITAGLAGFAWVITSSATVVPLLSDGCETGYIVEERSFLFAASGTVFRSDGIFVTAVESTRADDGYHPFADGAYVVEQSGDALRVRYAASRKAAASPVSTAGASAFFLPKLAGHTRACGLSTGARPPVEESPPPSYTRAELRAGVEDLSLASLEAAVGLVRDRTGARLDPESVAVEQEGCDEEGAQFVAALEFETDDNAASVMGILQRWDAAGYSRDRAMHEDLRYSETLPVATMSLRDTSTIDGLIHMRLTSQCSIDP
ncbi:hypothetical protein [Microbacterium sp. MMO-10]|uniref:hypothetical protein n=1 Tax=Microbacterium sp. MMO-10 TaxID=3081272 RepID=UPI0030188FC1